MATTGKTPAGNAQDGLDAGGAADDAMTHRPLLHHRDGLTVIEPGWTGWAVTAIDAGGTFWDGGKSFHGGVHRNNILILMSRQDE